MKRPVPRRTISPDAHLIAGGVVPELADGVPELIDDPARSNERQQMPCANVRGTRVGFG